MNDELTYEEVLENIKSYILSYKGRLPFFITVYFEILKEAIEKAKKYDELAKKEGFKQCRD